MWNPSHTLAQTETETGRKLQKDLKKGTKTEHRINLETKRRKDTKREVDLGKLQRIREGIEQKVPREETEQKLPRGEIEQKLLRGEIEQKPLRGGIEKKLRIKVDGRKVEPQIDLGRGVLTAIQV